MKVLVLGSGGRESALTWALARSEAVTELWAAPGNPGIAEHATCIDLDPSDPRAVVGVASVIDADLVVVGPEAPLVAGVADAVRAEGRRVFGPSAAAARIEGSKAHAKELMLEAGIPTGAGRAFRRVDPAIAYMDELGPPHVVKADGLAAGKGVVVTCDRNEAVDAVRERLEHGIFGDAGRSVVIEEFLDGEEVSLIAFTDGRSVVACQGAQDYKRAYDGDRGPNTGGMGSYSPVPSFPEDLAEAVVAEVIEPMVAATAAATPPAPFVGALYAGLALTNRGPRVVEFNARLGDPETQALLPRLESDLGEICAACAAGELEGMKLRWSKKACVAVVLASKGYPGPHDTGQPIEGLAAAEWCEGVQVFHAGTALLDHGIVTAGGRVLSVSALGDDLEAARAGAYGAAAHISFPGQQLRHDIGRRAAARETVSP